MLRTAMFEDNAVSMEAADDTVDKRIDAMIEMKDVNDKSFNAVNWRVAMDQIVEKGDKKSAKGLYPLLTKPMSDTLEKAITEGSLKDSDLPSKDGRAVLVDLGLMTIIAEKGEKMNAVTMQGHSFYKLAGGKKDDDAKKDDEKEKDDKKKEEKDDKKKEDDKK